MTDRRPSGPFQDTARDIVCSHLQSLGIAASRSARGRVEEEDGDGGFSSQGLIDISGGPISWANVLTRRSGRAAGYLVYGIPVSDPRARDELALMGDIQLWSVRVRRFPHFGKTVNVRWESYISLPRALSHLDEDASLKQIMVQGLRRDVEVRSRPSRGYWVMRVGNGGLLHLPSLEEWGCYQAIASALARVR